MGFVKLTRTQNWEMTHGSFRAATLSMVLLFAGHTLAFAQVDVDEPVTFARDTAPVLQRSCESCHRPGGGAPMSLITYRDVRPWARSMKQRTAVREMPPWFIDKNIGIQAFKDDPSLNDDEITLIGQWVDSGAPQGNPADMLPPLEWPAGEWTFGEPDLVISSPVITIEAVAPDWFGGIGPPFSTGLTEDRWIKAVEVKEVIVDEDGLEVARAAAASSATGNVGVMGALEVGALELHAQSADSGQIRHATGQTVVPIYEGWFEDPEGNIQVSFGYLNRNYEETIDIPIGPNNSIEPGPVDQGQPTHFPPRRQAGVFTIAVPMSAPDTEITWTLTYRGHTFSIPANLDPLFNVDSLRQSGGAYDGNTPPVLTFTSGDASAQGPAGTSIELTTSRSRPLTLDVRVSDDGLPPVRDHDVFYSRFEQRGGAASRPRPTPRGLTVRWSKYRGPGLVTFSDSDASVSQGEASTTAMFSQAGEFILRAQVVEGRRSGGQCCWTNGYVRVVVTPAERSR